MATRARVSKIVLHEAVGMLGEKRFFLETRQCLREGDRKSGVDALLERFNCPSLEDAKGDNTSQGACPHQCTRKDHPWLDGEGTGVHQFLDRDRDTEQEPADRDGVGGDDAEHLPLQSREQPELVQHILDHVAELVLGECGHGSIQKKLLPREW